MLISKEPVRRDIPHEPGEWMEFERLAAAELEVAAQVRSHQQLEVVRVLGAEFAKSMSDDVDENDPDGEAKAAAKAKRAQGRLALLQYDAANYHAGTLMALSVRSWSYEGGKPGDNPAEEVDIVTANWAAEVVVEISKPPGWGEEKNFTGDSADI